MEYPKKNNFSDLEKGPSPADNLPGWPPALLVLLDLLLTAFIFGSAWELLQVYSEHWGYRITFYTLWLSVPPLNAAWLLWRIAFIIDHLTAPEIRRAKGSNGRWLFGRLLSHGLIISLPTLVSWPLFIVGASEVFPPEAQFRLFWEMVTYSAAAIVGFLVAGIGILRLVERSCRRGGGILASVGAFSIWSTWSMLAFGVVALFVAPIYLLARWQLAAGVASAILLLIPSLGVTIWRLAVRWRAVVSCYRVV